MSPNSVESPLEKLLAWPLGVKTLICKDMCTKIFSGLLLVVAERELHKCPLVGKWLEIVAHGSCGIL